MSFITYARLKLDIPNVKDYSKYKYSVKIYAIRGGDIKNQNSGSFSKNGTTKEIAITSNNEKSSKDIYIVFDVFATDGTKLNSGNVQGRWLTQKGSSNTDISLGNTNAWPVYKPATTQGQSQISEGTTRTQNISDIKKVRLLFYGGARIPGDNSAFHFAAKNVEKDYKKRFPNDLIINKFVDSAKVIVDTINEQNEGSVASLDLFSHGSKWGLYFYKGASMATELSKEDISNNNLNAGLYGGTTTGWSSTDDHPDKRNIYDIKYNRFIGKGGIVELHGCESGGDLWLIDSISKNLSEELSKGYVIGHTTPANPNVNGAKTTNTEQDYRHGKRAIWQNGKVIKTTIQKYWLNISELVK